MTKTSGAPSGGAGQEPSSEVRPYLLRLVLLIVIALVLMSSIAAWAWSTYGKRLEEAPPLPTGKPLLNPAPARGTR